MPPSPGDLADVPHEERELSSFSELFACRALVYVPRDEDEVRRVLRWAHASMARVTFRAGGHSFDDQALPQDLPATARTHVGVDMSSLATIEVDAPNRRVTVGPGATWGDILAALQPHGLVPYVTVTTSHATAGGTLSGDCLSRFSPAYGKEGHHVRSFVVCTPDGGRHVCTPPAHGPPPRTLEERLFCGIIGGLGYLGAVTSITYDLLHVGETGGRIGVESFILKYDSFRELATELLAMALRTEKRGRHERHPELPDAVWSALSDLGGPQSLIVHSRFTSSADRNRMPNHQPDLAIRVPVEWALRSQGLLGFMWKVFFMLLRTGVRYVDDLEGFTFMMDGTVRAKHVAEGLGFSYRTLQQTFIVPVRSEVHAEETADRRLADFVDVCDRRFAEAGVKPTLLDVLYVPRDDVFLLSASRAMSGFAVSFAFEVNDRRLIGRIEECFVDLAEACLEAGGRVSLVKNVRARTPTLRAMFADALPAFLALKREVDPHGVLRNAFFDRHFGAAGPGGAP
jgi:decaprenylphospho-beta-D-ribofuranose 2-oxidase